MTKKQIYSYTLIHHLARLTLDITLTEYCITDIVYQITSNPKSRIPGWCYASKDYIAKCLGVSRKTVHANIAVLIEKGILEKQDGTGYLKAAPVWYETVVMCNERLQIVSEVSGRKGYTECNKRLHEVGKKVTPYSDNNNDKNIDTSADKPAQGELEELKPNNKVSQLSLQNVVLGFKIASGIPADDKAWDKTDYGKTVKYAKELLVYFNQDETRCLQCIEEIAHYMQENNLSWSPSTICKWKADWQAQKTSGEYRGLGKASEVIKNGGENSGR